jgi:hypothetical protein
VADHVVHRAAHQVQHPCFFYSTICNKKYRFCVYWVWKSYL